MAASAATSRSTSHWLQTGALLLITLIAYAPAMRAGFIWDDPDYVINNPNLRSARGLGSIWFSPRSLPQYYPLVHTSFWAEYQLWGLNAGGYHVVNILLHALAAILLWRVLAKLQVPGAWLAAAIFAVHPVHVESVAWITERKNVLSAVFYFAAALAYLRFDKRRDLFRDAREQGMAIKLVHVIWPRVWRWYAASVALFICAMLSKTVACSLPAALLLVIWWKRGKLAWRDLAPAIPMLAIGIGLAIYTAYLEKLHVGASGREWSYSVLDRFTLAGRALWFYAGKIIWPVNLSFIYPKWDLGREQIVFVIAALIALIVLWFLRDSLGRGVLVGVLFFAGTLLPALGFVNIYPMRYTFAADHYQYIASIGLITLIAAGIVKLIERASLKHSARMMVIGCIVLAPLMILTFARAGVFHDSLSLWMDTAAKNPDAWVVQLQLAQALARSQQPAEAEIHFRRAVELAPNLPETHWNLGVHLSTSGRSAEAMQSFDAALARDPTYAGAYYGRGNVYLSEGNLDRAKIEFTEAVRHFPDYPQAHFNLGVIAERQGNAAASARDVRAIHEYRNAIAEYEKAIAANPEYAEAHNALAKMLVKTHRFDDALGHYREALRIWPGFAEAHLNLGALLVAMGRMDEARREVAEAVRLDPTLAKYADQVLRN